MQFGGKVKVEGLRREGNLSSCPFNYSWRGTLEREKTSFWEFKLVPGQGPMPRTHMGSRNWLKPHPMKRPSLGRLEEQESVHSVV